MASFIDHLDPTSAIYSLLPLGRERIIVGGARHSLLKVFDIRMPSGRLYFSPTSSPSHTSETTAGWATYLTNHSHNSGFSRRSHRPERDSPVYSLAAGSVGGAKVFVGIEGGIWEFDFLGDSVGGVLRKPQQARFCTMYEFVGRTKLWKQGGEELLGSGGVMGAEGVLDGRWRVGGRV